MIGQLPKTLEIGGQEYVIRSDYRNILQIFAAYNDPDLSNQEKAFVCLKRMFCDFQIIPQRLYREAYSAATAFIECHTRGDGKPSPKIVNWVKDEQLIFPAVNKVAGMEIRAVPYLHWWTFLGYFQSINHDDLWGFVLMVRQKKAKGKKLEKHEQEFYRSNLDLCRVDDRPTPKTAEDTMRDLFNSLAEGGET